MPRTTVEALASKLAATTFHDLEAAVVTRAKASLRDTIGVMIAGSATVLADRVTAALTRSGAAGRATVVGRSERFGAAQAALANGAFAHVLELDDFGGCGHSGAVVIPAVLAAAEVAEADGRRVLEGVVAGYEAAAQATAAVGGYRAHNDVGWHSTGTCGSFGSAAGVARVLDLGPDATADALSLAGSFTGGLWAFIHDGAMSKRLHAGQAAANGLSAAFMAASGVTGPRHILDDRWGSFPNVYGSGDPDPVGADGTAPDGSDDHAIFQSGFKIYAACRGSHFSIDGLLTLLARHELTAEDVRRITLVCPEQTVLQQGGRDISTALDAQMSMPWAVAVALETGAAHHTWFAGERLQDRTIHDAMAKVRMEADPGLPSSVRPQVVLETMAGDRFTIRLDVARGDPAWPLTPEELTDKFFDLAQRVLPRAQVDRIHNAVAAVEALSSVQELCTATRPEA